MAAVRVRALGLGAVPGAGRPDEGVPFSERAIALFEMVGITAFLSRAVHPGTGRRGS